MASPFRNTGRLRISFFSFQDIITSVTGILILITLILSFFLNPLVSADLRSAPDEPITPITQATVDALQESNRLIQIQLTEAASVPDLSWLEALRGSLQEQERQITGQVAAFHEQRASLKEILSSNQVLEGISARLEDERKRAENALEAETQRTNAVFVIRGSPQSQKKPVMVQLSSAGITLQRLNSPPSAARTLPPGSVSSFRAAMADFQPASEYFVFVVKPSGIDAYRQCLEAVRNSQFEFGYEPIVESATVSFATAPEP